MKVLQQMFQKQDLDMYLKKDGLFERTLSAVDLIALGVGAVIGTGIFILPGTVAATKAGPGIIFSFVIAAVVCSLAAMCNAEFSSVLPVAGSAYSYSNIVYGEFVGWLIGWALVLEYVLAVAAVAVGWASYFNSFLSGFGLTLPKSITGSFDPNNGSYVNLIAIMIVFLIVGFFYIKPSNWSPFAPFGVKSIFRGAAVVFFAYLGFDCVSSSAAEVKNPKRNMPIGMMIVYINSISAL